MGEKSRQHYVPKFYLRNFSDSKKSIDTYNIANSKYIPNASIKDMCQKHNFYGSDKKVEDFLNVEIEAKASPIIKNILDTNKFPNDLEEYMQLLMFLLVSEARNLKMAESTNNMFDFIAKTMLKEHPDFKEMDLDSFKMEVKEPANHSIKFALESTPYVLDLERILLVEQTGARRFITSDNPLVRYDSFYLSKRYLGGFGYMTRGLQLFFPISPNKCILLYDSKAYDIPEVKNGILTLRKARDVDQLNELFYLNAYNNVFFNQKTKKDYIEGIHQKNKRMPRISELEREVASFKSVDSNGALVHLSQNRVTKKMNFSWIKSSQFANSLQIPAHMGGLNRMESPFIRQFIEEQRTKFAKERQPSAGKYFREER
ncbi:hypothetical protein BABA_10426 [Neobacillus bataviensis LMG 21833]|uniref:DUF4238 domain-containing protein n=1 Tax=Neobacillus bataviensis LMG 21833 TaxID=1117379 RepID=K6E7I5_9BACI|nr:DUF4238 domain-containing protein [Neobacillus bataviensis]EKN69271.1 hypothetical protein BABA_10426 [Neobacillus bataviensis LMG 21833]